MRSKRPLGRSTTPYLYRLVLAILLILPAWKKAQAYQDIAIGFASVEEGDDRLRPALQLYSTMGQDGYITATYYGRSFAQVEEKTYLLNIGARTALFSSRSFFAGLGGSALLEQTTVHARGLEKKDEDNAYNFGVSFALQYEYAWQRFYARTAWESSLFLAGEAGLFLATARKQAISITAGTRL